MNVKRGEEEGRQEKPLCPWMTEECEAETHPDKLRASGLSVRQAVTLGGGGLDGGAVSGGHFGATATKTVSHTSDLKISCLHSSRLIWRSVEMFSPLHLCNL